MLSFILRNKEKNNLEEKEMWEGARINRKREGNGSWLSAPSWAGIMLHILPFAVSGRSEEQGWRFFPLRILYYLTTHHCHKPTRRQTALGIIVLISNIRENTQSMCTEESSKQITGLSDLLSLICLGFSCLLMRNL